MKLSFEIRANGQPGKHFSKRCKVVVSHTITLVVGITLGVLLMIALYQPREDPVTVSGQMTETKATDNPTGRDVLTMEASPTTNNSSVSGNAESEIENTFSVNNEIQDFIPARTPAIYEDIVGPLVPMYTDAELHAIFKKEPWAPAMEEGINQQIAKLGAGEGVVIEYVECRSRTCEIAGYVIHGGEDKTSEMRSNIVRSGWWQGGNSLHISGGGRDDFDGFVMIAYDKKR